MADEVVNAAQNWGTLANNMLDIGIVLGTVILFLAVAAWALQRQASVMATI